MVFDRGVAADAARVWKLLRIANASYACSHRRQFLPIFGIPIGSRSLLCCTALRDLTSAQARLKAAHPGSPLWVEVEGRKLFRDHV